ncbi:MAG: rhomboid family intramembrane serine protease [Acidimicrobiales bacterium]
MAIDAPTCYRHPDRQAGVQCQRCGKAICPSCMHQASVGFHCPECVRSGAQKVHTARSLTYAKPVVTLTLIGINVAVWLYGLSVGGAPNRLAGEMIENYSLFGPFVDDGEWYRLITGGFLHAGLIHIAFNMYLLYVLGRQLERALGGVDFGILYLGGLLGGSFGALLVNPDSVTVGASGAVFGLMGGWIMFARSRGIDFMNSGIAGLVILNVLLTFGVSGISVGGHLGGLAGGLAVGWLLTVGRGVLPSRAAVRGASLAVCAALAVAGVWAASTWTDPIF